MSEAQVSEEGAQKPIMVWDDLLSRAKPLPDATVTYGYGADPLQVVDIWKPKSAGPHPAVLMIHGGCWQTAIATRDIMNWIADDLRSHGVGVWNVEYRGVDRGGGYPGTYADVGMAADMFASMRGEDGWRNDVPVVVIGHSAGGHLAAAMLATDWAKVSGVPGDLVKAAYAISGVFELEPLIPTSLNEALKLDAAKARAAGPLFWPAPGKDRTLVAAAGGDESQEFIRQSLAIASAWSKAGVKAECVVVPGTNHFTIVEELARPESAMVARIVGMAKGT